MTNVIGEAAVDIIGNDVRLTADLERARKKVEKFDRDASKASRAQAALAKSTSEIDKEVKQLARDYDPLIAAGIRYGEQIEKINRLTAQGKLLAVDQQRFLKSAAEEYKNAALQSSKMGKFAAFARSHIVALGAAAVAAAGTGIALMVKASFDNAKQLQDLAGKLDIGVEALQRWNYVASESGVSQAEFSQGLEQLTRSMGKASAGAEREAGAFQLLEVGLQDAEGKARSLEEVLPDLADGLSRIEDKNQRAAVAQVLFGNAAADILPALEGGSERINALSDAADELGIVLSAQQINRLDDAGKKVEALKNVLSARIAGIVADNADSILELTNTLEVFTRSIADFVSQWDLLKVSLAINPFDFLKIPRALGLVGGSGSPGVGEPGGPAVRVAINPSQPSPDNPIDASRFLASTRTRRGGRSGSGRAAQRASRARIQFENQIASLQAQILRESTRYLTDATAQAEVKEKLLEIERQRFERTVAEQQSSGRFTSAQTQQLTAEFDKLEAIKKQVIETEKQEQLLQEQTTKMVESLSSESQLLEIDLSLARSREERKELEEELLDLQIKMQKIQTQAILQSEETSEAEKEIAQLRLRYLDDLKDLQGLELERKYQTEVERFIDSLTMNREELDDAFDRIRASRMAENVERSAQFADDVGGAFANLGRDVLALRNPLDLLKSFLLDLTNIFNEEVLIRPLQEFARNKIGGPLAEQVTKAPAGPEGIWMRQLGNEALGATPKLMAMGDAAMVAATRFQQGQSVALDSLGGLAGSASKSGEALDATTASAAQFGGALSQIIANLSGGGGGGGILSTVLGLAASGLGGGAAPQARLLPSVNNLLDINPDGIFHEGGWVGRDGLPRRRQTGSREHLILAEEGERVMDRQTSARFGPVLDGIAEGRMPAMPGMGMSARMGGSRTYVGPTVNLGGVTVSGARDERSARRSARQVANEVNRRVAEASRKGYGNND